MYPQMWGSEGSNVITPQDAPLSAPSSAASYAALSGGSCAAASAAGTKEHARWSPYEMNGGSSLGIAGADFAVIAADTRLSEGYSIMTRDISRSTVLTSKCVIATGGCHTDVHTLHKVLAGRVDSYRHAHDSDMSCTALAQMLGNTLYYRRFFPYYAFNVVAGIDSEGKGAVYTYDAVGSFERVGYAAQGSAQHLIIPLLDNLVGRKNRTDAPTPLTVTEAVELLKEAFVTAGERDIYTGDAVEIFAITSAGVTKERFELKKD